jgi:tetratricopeptide (TPR) repeat protein
MDERALTLIHCTTYTTGLALALYERLCAEGIDVFFDADARDRSSDLHLRQVEARPHFLVLVSRGLLEALQRPDDALRQEFDRAVETRRNIVLLMAHGFSFNNTFLPDEITFLRRYYALPLLPETLEETVTALSARLARTRIFGTLTPLTPEDEAASAEIRARTAAQPQPSANELRAETIFNEIRSTSRQDTSQRMAEYDEALRLNPYFTALRFDRARARCRVGDEAGAIADYNEILRLQPDHYKAYNNRAELHFALGNYAQALADFDQTLAFAPEFIMAICGRALTLHALGRATEALAIWNTLLEQDERFHDALWVGREMSLPSAMVAEAHRLTMRLKAQPDAADR